MFFLATVNVRGFPSCSHKGGNLGCIRVIDFETLHRPRLYGTASIDPEDPLRAYYAEADMVVRVGIEETFENCPHYVHRYKRVAPSKYVPRKGVETPVASRKKSTSSRTIFPQKTEKNLPGAVARAAD